MTTEVISAGPKSTVEEVAGALRANRVRALPVLDDGQVLGVVSEADLMTTVALGDPTPIPPRRPAGSGAMHGAPPAVPRPLSS